MKAFVATICIALFLIACTHVPVQTTFGLPWPERNANGDPVRAAYEGRVPCGAEDCEQLKITLALYHDQASKAPTTYLLSVVRVGNGNDPVKRHGIWRISRGVRDYPDALAYVLDANADPALRYYWCINEDIVMLLDSTMRPKVGNASWGNMLSRYSMPYGPRTYRYDYHARQFVGSGSTKEYGADAQSQMQ